VREDRRQSRPEDAEAPGSGRWSSIEPEPVVGERFRQPSGRPVIDG